MPDKDLNYVINSEKGVTDLLKKLYNKNPSSEGTYNKPAVSKPGTVDGSAKAHEPLKNRLTPFKSIISAIGTPKNKMEKFLVPILSDVTQNEFTVQDFSIIFDEIWA